MVPEPCAWLQVHEHRSRHVAAARGLVEVDVDALQLQVRVPVVGARGVDAVLVRDDLHYMASVLYILKGEYIL